MAAKRPNKSVYKIYIKREDVYYSSSSSKATWTSLKWALSAADDAMRYYRLQPIDIEVHEFPVTDAIKHSYLQILQEEEAARRRAEKEVEVKKRRRDREEIKQAQTEIQAAQENIRKSIDFLKSKGVTVNEFSFD